MLSPDLSVMESLHGFFFFIYFELISKHDLLLLLLLFLKAKYLLNAGVIERENKIQSQQ